MASGLATPRKIDKETLVFQDASRNSWMPIILTTLFWLLVLSIFFIAGVRSFLFSLILLAFALFSMIPYYKSKILTEVYTSEICVKSPNGKLLKRIPFTSVKSRKVLSRTSVFVEPSNALSGWLSSYAWGLRGAYYGFSGKGVVLEIYNEPDIVIGSENPQALVDAIDKAMAL